MNVFLGQMKTKCFFLPRRVIGQSGMGALAPSFHHWQGSQVKFKKNQLIKGCFLIHSQSKTRFHILQGQALTISSKNFTSG